MTINELENVSGGKTSKITLGCSLLALLGFLSITSNVISSEFIKFTATEEFKNYNHYDNTTLGEIPFYLQADHVVDGILWFKHPTKNLAFFVLDRKINSENKEEYTNSDYNDIKKFEYKLLDVSKLEEPLAKNFKEAEKNIFNEKHQKSIQLAEDNPLFNFSRFYNKNYLFSKNSSREKLNDIPMYASIEDDSFVQIDWDEKIKNDKDKLAYAKMVKERLDKEISWKIAHRLVLDETPKFEVIESSRTLNAHYKYGSAHTEDTDKNILRNDGFTFFTLCATPNAPALPPMFLGKENIQETVLDFTDIPLVSCSEDMLPRLKPELDMFYQEDDHLLDKFPCFNRSSEEVKEQLEVYYVNEKNNELEKGRLY